MGFGLDGLIYCTLYIHTTRDYREYNSVAVLHTFQFTIAHALGFSALTSCILATDLSQSHCNFKSHVKSSYHSFLPYLQLPILKTRVDYSQLLFYTLLYSVYSECAVLQLSMNPMENTVFYCQECMFTCPLLSNGCPSVVVYACVVGMCLPTCCLAVGIHIILSCMR
jgi:hypothetical protein